MTEYIYLTISFVALYFSYLFTLIENAYLTLSPAKISKLEDLEIENLSIIKKLLEKVCHEL